MLPDLSLLSDDELSALLARLESAEDAISQRRRLLHGRIDILRGERTQRLRAQVTAGGLDLPSPTTLERAIYTGTGEVPEDEGALGAMPDLAEVDDDALRAEIRRLEQEEDDISLNRRVLHGQIDIVRAERARRSRDGGHIGPDDLGPVLGGAR